MQDIDCVQFLQWALPLNHMRWPGFRRVRRQVCRRLSMRLQQLNLQHINAYRNFLLRHPQEWQIFDKLCWVTISRFYRDKLVFVQLSETILPTLAMQAESTRGKRVSIWSIGCGSGEEPYTLAIIWQQILKPQFPGINLSIYATDASSRLLERCRQASYPASSIKNLPLTLRNMAFNLRNEQYYLKECYKHTVEFAQQDIRQTMPEEIFDLVLCRNLVFTYFDELLQEKLLRQIVAHLNPNGWLVLGVHEKLPDNSCGLTIISERLGLYQKQSKIHV